jgi:hypothetical protein
MSEDESSRAERTPDSAVAILLGAAKRGNAPHTNRLQP